jgi:hypothetical protein
MRTAVLLVATIAAFATPARAQLPKPLPVAVIDVRGFYSGLGQDPTTAAGLSEIGQPVAATDLPRRGLGGVVGVHWYLLRKKNIAVGIGGEAMLARGHAQQKDETTGEPVGLPITQRFQGTAGLLSLNFGHRDGWSYVSAGMGPLTFNTYQGEQPPAAAPPFKMTIHLAAGARWFASRHFAFCFDLHFYQTKPEIATESYPGRDRANIRVLSAGIAIR